MILLVAGGFAGGFTSGAVFRSVFKKTKLPPQSQMVCPCKHSRGHHLGDGECQASQLRYVTGSKQQMVKCGCTKYFGPKMIEEWTPERFSLPFEGDES